ncbi:hypothetical protein D3C71_1737580 [compost metagenome]
MVGDALVIRAAAIGDDDPACAGGVYVHGLVADAHARHQFQRRHGGDFGSGQPDGADGQHGLETRGVRGDGGLPFFRRGRIGDVVALLQAFQVGGHHGA